MFRLIQHLAPVRVCPVLVPALVPAPEAVPPAVLKSRCTNALNVTL